MTGHLDLDALADALAGDTPSTQAHLAGCPECRSALAELRESAIRVTAALAALPALPVPGPVAAELASTLAAEPPAAGSRVTALPLATGRRPGRWLAAAAAAVVLLGGIGYGLAQRGSTRSGAASTSAAGPAAAPERGVVRNSTGTDYTTRAGLAVAVPALVAGTAASSQLAAGAPPAPARAKSSASSDRATSPSLAVGDPLARLRTDAGLADCLLALLPPADPSLRPLAVDYAAFRHAPAMVVLLPSPRPGKLDVFVVGPGCSQANDSTLFYTSVDAP